MPSKAKVTLIGHLGRDPETRYTPSGAMNVGFSIATSQKRGDQETTTWWRITAWGRLAETMDRLAQSGAIHKGSLVYVEGVPSLREYTTDNGPRTSLDVNANDVLILGGRGDNGGGQQAQQSYASSDLDVPF